MRKIEERILKAIRDGSKEYLSKRDRVDFPLGADIVARVWLHKTAIADIMTDRVVVNTGGWHTVTTKSRLNAILDAYTDCAIIQEAYQWYLIERLTPGGWMTDKSSRKAFFDGMSIPRVR